VPHARDIFIRKCVNKLLQVCLVSQRKQKLIVRSKREETEETYRVQAISRSTLKALV